MKRYWLWLGLVGTLAVVAGAAAIVEVNSSGSGTTSSSGPVRVASLPISSPPRGPGIYHQQFWSVMAQPIPGDRRHWSIAQSHEVALGDEWTQLGKGGQVLRRVVTMRSPNGDLVSRSLQTHHSLNTYFAKPNNVLAEPSPGPSAAFSTPSLVVNPRGLIGLARRNSKDSVRYLGIEKLNGERLAVVSLQVLQANGGFGMFPQYGYETTRMYFTPGTKVLRAMDVGILPAEPCWTDATQSKAACYKYALRPRPSSRTVWTLSQAVPPGRVSPHIFKLGAPKGARWFTPDALF